MARVQNLVALLAQDPSTTAINYRQKVKSLRLDVSILTSRFDIKDLVAKCPRLSDLDICHYKDMAPYRQLDENLRWSYPASLFEALGVSLSGPPNHDGASTIKLKSWRWSQRMMGKGLTFVNVRDIHASPVFSSLRKISFVNYQLPSLCAKDVGDAKVASEEWKYAESLAGLLGALPDLRHLVVESSTAANEILLPLLPKSLQHIELINCWEITAECFSDYLRSHGGALRYLTLHHNQSLSLAFLPVLREACPNLQALRMNLTYFSHHEFYRDSNPEYISLLEPDQVPTWPASIEVIELENLRKWDADSAESFFQSLIDSSPQLPLLRHLAIKAILDIPWRQRSQMRDKWEARLKEVFHRKSDVPRPARSLRWTAAEHDLKTRPKRWKNPRKNITPSRRSGRIATQASGPSSRASSAARDLRKPDGPRISYREPDSDEDMESDREEEHVSEAEADHVLSPASVRAGPFIQGLCDVVDIRIDNQKPVETQFRMEDFVDTDNAGSDEEWSEAGDS